MEAPQAPIQIPKPSPGTIHNPVMPVPEPQIVPQKIPGAPIPAGQ